MVIQSTLSFYCILFLFYFVLFSSVASIFKGSIITNNRNRFYTTFYC